MCEENVPQMPIRKKYNVTASKHEYFSEDYDTQEEMITATTDLISRGFTGVSIRDNESMNGDIW